MSDERRGIDILAEHYSNGVIYWSDEEGQYIGIAQNGQHVGLGGNLTSLFAYLKDHPTPAD
jgi:hypothetical protein